MKKYLIPIVSVLLILVLASPNLLSTKPKDCAICDSIPYHAPCLVNLSTGEVGELTLYAPHPYKVAELNPYQQGGTFRFISAAGLQGFCDTDNWQVYITIPSNENEYEEKFFCKSCRKQISSNTEHGYLLLDLREPENFSILSFTSDNVQIVRCYEIQATQLPDEIEIKIYGTLQIADHIIQ